MVVAQLRQMCNSNGNVLDGLLEILVLHAGIVFIMESGVDDVKSQVEIGFRFIGNQPDSLLYFLPALLRCVFVDVHNYLVVSLR